MKTFTAQVRVGDQRYGNGVGRSKKEAEQAAAETAYGELAARSAPDPHRPRRASPATALTARRARAARGRDRPRRPRAPRRRPHRSTPSPSSTRVLYAATTAAPPASPRR